MEHLLALQMFYSGLIGLILLLPLLVSEIQRYRAQEPALAWSISGFVVVGHKARARTGVLYDLQFQHIWY